MKYIVNRPDFKLYTIINRCDRPHDFYQVKFVRESYDEKTHKLLSTSEYELYVNKQELELLSASIAVE